ncbi:hypothetical protein C8Q77DRAFT_1155311 [Trametes polyzona]|nr:hypothetical protein C8Q77DRAFT_1155311 [Trametes polyzona]
MPGDSSSYLSSPSLVSVASTSTATSSTPLTQSSRPLPAKDYSAAFGHLQSQYGWGGPVQPPMRPVASSRPKEKKEQRKETRATSTQEPAKTARETKNFEAAHAALSSRFGFGGSWPTPKKQSKSKTKDEQR